MALRIALDELNNRLNDTAYKNWLKASQCLRILNNFLCLYTDKEMHSFHRNLLDRNSFIRQPCQRSCKPKGNRLPAGCTVCSEWQKVILRHHRQPDATVNWDNCSPPSWRHDHWELAKAYMPRGQGRNKGARQCDASALLNLINYCDHFRAINPKFVREHSKFRPRVALSLRVFNHRPATTGLVIRCRNEIMHSCEMRVNDMWLSSYQRCLEDFLRQFHHVAEMATVAQDIHKMLTVDWSICLHGLDQMDSTEPDELVTDSFSQSEATAISIGQWEVELLKERLQELLNDTETQNTEGLLMLRDFLRAYRDLAEHFSAELEDVGTLEARLRGGGGREEEEEAREEEIV